MKHIIGITDCDHKDICQEQEVFSQNHVGYQLFQCKTEHDLVCQCKGIPVLLNQYAPMTESVISQLAPDLRQIVRYGVGVDNIDLEAASRWGVQVCNVTDYGVNEVADHALSLMLALVRKVPLMNRYTKEQTWDYTRAIPVRRLSTLQVGIVGLGRIGRAFAARVHALGCAIIGYDPGRIPEDAEEMAYIRRVSFETLLQESDVISIHCPADNARKIFDAGALAQMKSGSYLINTARGGIIDENALEDALDKGPLAGTALDVFSQEPVPLSNRLLQMENLICTPHMAWYSEESSVDLKRKAAEEAVRFLRKEALHYPVNRLG